MKYLNYLFCNAIYLHSYRRTRNVLVTLPNRLDISFMLTWKWRILCVLWILSAATCLFKNDHFHTVLQIKNFLTNRDCLVCRTV